MNKICELRAILGKTLHWNKCRLDCFIQMLLALFITRTVNLSELAVAMASRAAIPSRYKRLQRFFSQWRLDYDVIAKFIFNLFFSGKKVYLTIDRTNWYWGKHKRNVLTLAVAYVRIKDGSTMRIRNKKYLTTKKIFSHLCNLFATMGNRDVVFMLKRKRLSF